MKKMRIFSLAIVMAILCLCTMQISFADEVIITTPEGAPCYYDSASGMTYTYDTTNNTAATYIYGTYDGTTWRYNTTSTAAVIIPATIDVDGVLYDVTTIGENTFGAKTNVRGQSKAAENSATSITLPEGITSIEQNAFYGCKGIKSLVIPSTVTSLGKYSFSGCSAMTTLKFSIGCSITDIPDSCFQNCYKLTELDFPKTVNKIHMNAFVNARALKTVRILNSDATLQAASKDYGFPPAMGVYLKDGAEAEVPTVFYVSSDSVKEQLKNLAEKDVMSGANKYKLSGFKDGSQVKFFFENDNIVYEPYGENNTDAIITGNIIPANTLKNVVIPDKINVAEIGEGGTTFTVKAVGPQAFCYLDGSGDPVTGGKTINSIILPDTVTSIGKEAFWRQNYLKSFAAKGDIVLKDDDTGIFKGCSQLAEIDFKSINRLTDNMFFTCSKLETIVIPTGSLITIDKTAFDRSNILTDVYLNASTVVLNGEDSADPKDMRALPIKFHVPTDAAKAAFTDYGIDAERVIVSKKIYLLDNLLGTYAVAPEEIEGKVIVATFKDDVLDSVDEIKDVDFNIGYNEITTALEKTKDIERKLFVWKDLTSITPLGAMIN